MRSFGHGGSHVCDALKRSGMQNLRHQLQILYALVHPNKCCTPWVQARMILFSGFYLPLKGGHIGTYNSLRALCLRIQSLNLNPKEPNNMSPRHLLHTLSIPYLGLIFLLIPPLSSMPIISMLVLLMLIPPLMPHLTLQSLLLDPLIPTKPPHTQPSQ